MTRTDRAAPVAPLSIPFAKARHLAGPFSFQEMTMPTEPTFIPPVLQRVYVAIYEHRHGTDGRDGLQAGERLPPPVAEYSP